MKKIVPTVLFAMMAGSSLAAETIISPDEFDEITKESTVYFDRHGQPFGTEQYYGNRRVIWTFNNGECQRGFWFAQGEEVCFQYENRSESLCWHFLRTETGMAARVVGDSPENDLTVSGQDKEPLNCPAPEVGVKYVPQHIDIDS